LLEAERRPLTAEEAENCMFYFKGPRALHEVAIEKENVSMSMKMDHDYEVLKFLPDKHSTLFGMVVLDVEVGLESNK